MSARAWVLNVDVERELATPDATLGEPSAAVRTAVAMARRRLRSTLVGPDDVVIGEDPTGRARGLEGRAWCPTPSALAALRAAGAHVREAPTLEALRTVNAKPFGARLAAELGEPLTKHVVTNMDEARARLTDRSHASWLVRRPFGAAGRARRKVLSGTPSKDDEEWLNASFERGVVVVEPCVDVVAEFALHGVIDERGRLERGVVCTQDVDPNGLWTATRPEAPDLDDAQRHALERAFAHAAQRASEVGYFGPLGVDALRYRDGDDVRFQALGDLNGRYSMGWAIGMRSLAR